MLEEHAVTVLHDVRLALGLHLAGLRREDRANVAELQEYGKGGRQEGEEKNEWIEEGV